MAHKANKEDKKLAQIEPQVMAALCDFIATSPTAEWPEEMLDLGRRHILDTLASIVACRDLKPSVLARNFALAHSGDATTNAATILGTRKRAALRDAVFASAMTGHGGEINDFCPSAFVQPGPPIVSAALGLAELRGNSGAELLRAVIAGYEIACRMPKAVGIENSRRMNISSHGFGPVFGVGVAASSLMRMPKKRIAHLISYCSQLACGSRQWMLDVEHIEKAYVFAGIGAQNGLQAALLVEAGFTGVVDNLDQPGGWMNSKMFTIDGSDIDRAYLVEDLGKRFELPLVAYKRYPVGGPTQPAVHALLELINKIERRQVEHVKIEMPGMHDVFRDAAMPALSLPYLSAIILIDGKLDFDAAQSLERMVGDPAVSALMQKVEVLHDASQMHKPGEPRTESARVTLTLRDGTSVQSYVGHVPGYPSHPLTRAEVEQKAAELMVPRLGEARAREVIEKTAMIDRLQRADELANLIAL